MASASQPLAGFLRRNTFAVLCCTLSVVFAGVDFYLWRESHSLERRVAERTAEGEANLALIASGPLLRQQHAAAKGAADRIDANLLVEANLADNLVQFYKQEEATGARVSGLNQLSGRAHEDGGAPYKAIPFTLEVAGTFEQVAEFLFRLETGPQVLRVTAFTLQRASADGAQVTLNLSVEVLGKP